MLMSSTFSRIDYGKLSIKNGWIVYVMSRLKIFFEFLLVWFSSELREFSVPKTVTCRVLSSDTLKALSNCSVENDHAGNQHLSQKCSGSQPSQIAEIVLPSLSYSDSTLVFAGLHACGDLSVSMLRTFLECDKAKAVISVGCCYNLLSEEAIDIADSCCGFPVSQGVKSAGIALDKNARDLALSEC